MTFKVSGNKRLKRTLLRFPKEVSSNFSRALKDVIGDMIISELNAGKSPVRGKKFKKYSDSYVSQMGKGDLRGKKDRPVNLKVTGELHKSLVIRQIKKTGSLFIKFTSDLADIHNRRGAGRSKEVRRMLPTNNGERFNIKITRLIKSVLERAVKKSVKKT